MKLNNHFKSVPFFLKTICHPKNGTTFILAVSLLFVGATPSQGVPFQSSKIAISAHSPYAVKAGEEIFRKGGNVVDVAVAVGLALGVTSPYMAALGGGGFALVKMNDHPVSVLDFREMAPAATHPKFYVNNPKLSSTKGGAAVGVPGMPAGFYALHKKYGKLSWGRVVSPSVRLAQKGYRVSGQWASYTKKAKTKFSPGGLKYFFKKGRKSYKPGEVFKQKQLARLLRKIKAQKAKAFYKGSVAKDIVKSVQKSGGVMTVKDLKNYKVRWLKPLKTRYRGHTIYTMPPPSSGGIVLHSALKLSEYIKLQMKQPLSINEFHYIGEILSRAFRGRSLLGDPDFHKNPLTYLTSDKYLKKMARTIRGNQTRKLKPFKPSFVPPKSSTETTHFSVIDAKGNAVSVTVTLNGAYGSGVVTKKYGIALNNEMDDFTTRPNEPNMFGLYQGPGNMVEPRKRPLSSMSPTIVTKDDKAVIAVGAQGGPRIISTVYQVIYRMLTHGYDIDEALQSPRVHHQFLPHKLIVDTSYRFTPDAIKGLKKRGHKVEKAKWSPKGFGVSRNNKGILESSHDSRGEGSVGGY